MTIDLKQERKQFEAEIGPLLIADQGEFALSRAHDEDRSYTFLATKWAYLAWQRGRAQPTPPAGYCAEGDRCVCGGDTPGVRAGCGNWKASATQSAVSRAMSDAVPVGRMGEAFIIPLKDLPTGTLVYAAPQPSASPAALTMPAGFAIKRVEGHGWVVEEPSGSRWVAHEGTPAGDFIAALLAASPAAPQPSAKALTDEAIAKRAWDEAWQLAYSDGMAAGHPLGYSCLDCDTEWQGSGARKALLANHIGDATDMAAEAGAPEGRRLVWARPNDAIRGVLYQYGRLRSDNFMTPEQADLLWAMLLSAASAGEGN